MAHDKIYSLILLNNNALNQIKSNLDDLIVFDLNLIPFFFEKNNFKQCKKDWMKIDQDLYFQKILEKMISFDPLFSQISNEFKNQLKKSITHTFFEMYSKDPERIYPSWSRFWHDFYINYWIQIEDYSNNINDKILIEKYNSIIENQKKADLILGFSFHEEYARLKNTGIDSNFYNKVKKYKNSMNKKVS